MNNMEEQKQPSFEELAQEYNRILMENRQLQATLQQMQFDRTNDQIKTLLEIVKNKDNFSAKTIKLAEWHIQKMIAKPKKSK